MPFLPLNLEKKITLFENFHGEYIVITLQALDSIDKDCNHLHFIVVKVNGDCVVFDIHELLQTIPSTSMEDLRLSLNQSMYLRYIYF